MPGSLLRPTSIRKRLRYLTTAAFVLTVLAAMATLVNGHVVHGALMLLAAMALLPGSIWGRRHRQHPRVATLATTLSAAPRRWRKAA